MLSGVYHQTFLPPHRDWGSQSEWFKKLHLLGPRAHYILKHQGVLLKERTDYHEMLFFKQVSVLIFQRLCHSVKRGTSVRRTWLKEFPSHLDFLSTVTLECRLSCPFTPLSLCRASLFLPCVLMLYFVSVIRYIRRSKITVSVVSHSFRGTGLLSKMPLLGCSAGGIIDQYPVCSLFYIWLVNLTHSVPISYAVLAHLSGSGSNIYIKLSKGWQYKSEWFIICSSEPL